MSVLYRGYEIISGPNCYLIKRNNTFVFSVQSGDNPQIEVDKYIEEEDQREP